MGVIYPRPGFLTTAPKLLGFFRTLPWLFLDIYWLQNPQSFPIFVTIPHFSGKQIAPQMAKNWLQPYLGLGMPQMEKSDGYIHDFMCSQAIGSSGNFSWRHMQTGSRNPPKTEVVITGRLEDMSAWSQRLRHTFSGMLDPLPLVSTESDYGEHYQVQTGSRNSLSNRKYY